MKCPCKFLSCVAEKLSRPVVKLKSNVDLKVCKSKTADKPVISVESSCDREIQLIHCIAALSALLAVMEIVSLFDKK